jgi:hypothetical protein
MISCQKKETETPYYPCVPAQFSVKGNFTIDLADLKPTNVKEVRLDIRTAVNDTFKITILRRDKCLYLKLNYDEAVQTNLMTWIVKGDDCLNTIHGNVNQPIQGYINIIYYK